MGEKEIVLIAVLIVLAVFLHIFSVCGWYRRGFDEGYEKGLASRREPVDEPKVVKTASNIKTIKCFYYPPSPQMSNPIVAQVELERGISEQIIPYIRKAAREDKIHGVVNYRAELKIIDECGVALEYEEGAYDSRKSD